MKSSKSSYEGRLNNLQSENQQNKDKIEKLECENQKLQSICTNSKKVNEGKIQSLKDQMRKLVETSVKANRDALKNVTMEMQQLQSTVAGMKKPKKIVSFDWKVRELQLYQFGPIFKTGECGYHFKLCYCNYDYPDDIKIEIERKQGINDDNLPEIFNCDAELIIQTLPTSSAGTKRVVFHDNFQFELGNKYNCCVHLLSISIDNFLNLDIKVSLHIPWNHPAVN